MFDWFEGGEKIKSAQFSTGPTCGEYGYESESLKNPYLVRIF
jgi:hypothetical protein